MGYFSPLGTRDIFLYAPFHRSNKLPFVTPLNITILSSIGWNEKLIGSTLNRYNLGTFKIGPRHCIELKANYGHTLTSASRFSVGSTSSPLYRLHARSWPTYTPPCGFGTPSGRTSRPRSLEARVKANRSNRI